MPVRRPLFALGLILALATSATAQPPRTIHTNQQLFNIPFRISPVADAAEAPVEVQLHLSDDGGQSWRLFSKVSPQDRHFTFHAPKDGEYCFMVRTLNRQQGLLPRAPAAPELRVVVDTLPPQIEAAVWREPDGRLTARWQVTEPSLDPATLQLEYRTGGSDAPWETVPADALGAAANGLQEGSVSWETADGGSLLFEVRLSVNDLAGNQASRPARVTAGPVEFEVQPPNEDDRRATPVRSVSNSGPILWPGEPSSEGPPRGYTDESVPLPRGMPGENVPPPRMPETYPDTSTGELGELTPAEEMPLPSPELGAPRGPGSNGMDRAGWNRSAAGSQDWREPLPAEEVSADRTTYVNSATFELDYQIDQASPWGIGQVELWGTRDGGRSWRSFGVDSDQASPMVTTVDEEGVYGFRLAIGSLEDRQQQAPLPGERPEIVVRVDVTLPGVQLVDWKQGIGANAGKLIIRWQATDDVELDTAPIAISYSPSATGPWTVIARDLENSGSFAWLLDRSGPDRVYLRVTARDRAGNEQSAESIEPVYLGVFRPEGRIREIRPRSDANGGAVRLRNRY
jgi:hypothetical protein